MGVDALDLVFRIEKAFQIKLPKDDFLALAKDQDVVVGDLYDLVLAKLQLRDAGRNDFGLNYRLWAEMQAVLERVSDVRSEAIALQTPLERLFPRPTRRFQWDALRETCPYRVGELDYPLVVRTCGFLLAAAVAIIEQARLWQIRGLAWLWPVLGLVGIWMVSETYLKILSICAPWRTRFPRGMKTVKDLCRVVLAANYAELCRRADTRSDERAPAVWEQLVEILADVVGVQPERVTFRSRLVRDLGMT